MKHARFRRAAARQPSAFWPAPDFLPRPQRTPWLAWLLLVAGSLAFGLAGLDWWATQQAAKQSQQRLARWQQELRPVRAVATRASASAQTEVGATAAQALSRRLDHPWQTLFQATETEAAPGVRWLRLEHDAERGTVRMEGVANDLAAVVRGLDVLSAAAAWHEVSLVRVDAGPAGNGSPAGPLRFELRARHGGADEAPGARP
ncbi:MAG: hypothetical protein Q8R33_25590 [Burkholderiales bacterium]|nr:hypothetical protein [Burkholderiales bacterium]